MDTKPVSLFVESTGRRYTFTPVPGDPNQVIERSQIAPREPGDIVVDDMVDLEDWLIENHLMMPRHLGQAGLAKAWRSLKLDTTIPKVLKIVGITGNGQSENTLFKIYDPRYKAH